MHTNTKARLSGAEVRRRIGWEQCSCGRSGCSKARKAERKIQRRVERQAFRKQLSAEWAYAGGFA